MNPESRRITKAEREGALIGPHGEAIFPKNRIAACMILGDSYDKDELIACVDSIKNAGIDKLFIAYNGKTRRSLQWLFTHITEIKLPFLIKKFRWEKDFSLARNQSFEMVPREEFDWIMWIDHDDEIVADVSLDEMIAGIDEYTQGIYLRYDYASDSETGEVVVRQWRERIFTTKVEWKWVYPIHEVVFSPTGTQFAKREGVYIKHARSVDDTRSESTAKRNREIIAKALKENPKHPRMQFYFANEVMAEAHTETDPEQKFRTCDAAILAFSRFLSNDAAPQEDMYLAANRIGELYLESGRASQSVDAFLNALKILPDWPDAFIGIARAAMDLEDWPKCKSFANLALSLEAPVTSSAVTPLTYKYTPLLLRGIAEEHLGNLDQAMADYNAAIAVYNPSNGMLAQKIESLQQRIAVQPKTKDERKTLRGKRPEKSIAFVTAPLVESWHPKIEAESGAGGAETCIMRLAPRFAADGWRVAVFGTPGDHRGVDENGVEWWESREFLPNERFKVVVGSRIPEVFEGEVAADHKLLWMHDVNVGPRLSAFEHRVDRIIGLTMWHVRHLSSLYDIPIQKFAMIPNGIELDLYDWSKKEESTSNELRLIWSSSADRGLNVLIALWPMIKKAYPTARLDVFYGWNIIDKLIKKSQNGYLIQLKNEVIQNIAQMGGPEAGIYQHGRVPQSELARWQMNSHIWPYPTDFMETFCITAVEMQAAGVIPVTSNLAALTEMVANKDLLVEGWPRNVDYQSRWLKKFMEVVESRPERQEELQASGRRFAEMFTWDNSYIMWQNLIRRLDAGN